MTLERLFTAVKLNSDVGLQRFIQSFHCSREQQPVLHEET